MDGPAQDVHKFHAGRTRFPLYIGLASSQEKQLSRVLANFLRQQKVNIPRKNTQEVGN